MRCMIRVVSETSRIGPASIIEPTASIGIPTGTIRQAQAQLGAYDGEDDWLNGVPLARAQA